jgi:hypothetical protein
MHGAWKLLRDAERYIPDDPQLRQMRDVVTAVTSIRTVPDGAEVFIKDYGDPDDAWEMIGRSPLDQVRIPHGYLRWKFVKPGYEPLEAAKSFRFDAPLRLEPKESVPPGMVRVPAGEFQMGGSPAVHLADYWIDKYEVTNRQFKDFMDGGGYQNRQYWKQPLIDHGRPISWEEATLKFRDATGRPGPSTWDLGAYPDGQADFPVSGVSWYEAAAYAEFAGKALPTAHQWFNAAGAGIFSDILRFSNLDHKRCGACGQLSRDGAVRDL